jgi:predicted nucleic acid-binding protein
MSAEPFLDTNVLLYAFSDDPRSAAAEALMSAGGTISVQVLNEFVNVSRRKLGRDWDDIEAALSVIRTLLGPVRPLTVTIHEAAVALARRLGYGLYDALILSSALEAGCDTLWTEDLRDGQVVEGVTIRNPFA